MRFSAAYLTLLFVLSLSVVPMTHAQPPPPETTKVRYYLQSGDPTTVPYTHWGAENVYGLPAASNMTVFNMDTPTPHGAQVACSWCDFASRPLVNRYVFLSFKLHLYVRWPTQCEAEGLPTLLVNHSFSTYIALGIGSAPSDISTIYGYPYKDYGHPVTSIEVTVLDIGLSGYDVNVGNEVRVAVGAGQRLVFHFGLTPTMLGSDAPCLVWTTPPVGYLVDPTILFGDSEHASYIETDAVELQGQPIPELPLPALILLLSLVVTYGIRRKASRDKIES